MRQLKSLSLSVFCFCAIHVEARATVALECPNPADFKIRCATTENGAVCVGHTSNNQWEGFASTAGNSCANSLPSGTAELTLGASVALKTFGNGTPQCTYSTSEGDIVFDASTFSYKGCEVKPVQLDKGPKTQVKDQPVKNQFNCL